MKDIGCAKHPNSISPLALLYASASEFLSPSGLEELASVYRVTEQLASSISVKVC